MRKSPVLFSLGLTFVIWLAVLLYLGETTRNPDEMAFTTAFMFLIFPFAWFTTWIIVNAVVWWLGVTGRGEEDDADPRVPGEAESRAKKPNG